MPEEPIGWGWAGDDWAGEDADPICRPGAEPDHPPGLGPDPWAGAQPLPLIDEDFQPVDFDSVTAIDVDGDGVLETMIVRSGSEVTVVYDLDGDGRTDYQTAIGPDGGAVSWFEHRADDGTRHWHRIDDDPDPGAGPGPGAGGGPGGGPATG